MCYLNEKMILSKNLSNDEKTLRNKKIIENFSLKISKQNSPKKNFFSFIYQEKGQIQQIYRVSLPRQRQAK